MVAPTTRHLSEMLPTIIETIVEAYHGVIRFVINVWSILFKDTEKSVKFIFSDYDISFILDSEKNVKFVRSTYTLKFIR